MRIALGIEYNGTPFSGWQVQPDLPTVQGTLEEALRRFAGEGVPIATICAGRTDTGVHATGQVVHIDVPMRRPEHAWIRGTNAFLPPEVAVRWAREVDEEFSARFSASERVYEYWIANDPVRVPTLAGRTGWCFRPCDEKKMAEAAQALLGTHDFTSFRASECQAKSPVRTLKEITVRRAGRLIGIRLRADGFLHHMVRNIVGTLVYIGIGREEVAWCREVLEAKNRSAAAPTFDASGLYLTGVTYPGYDLPASGASPFLFG